MPVLLILCQHHYSESKVWDLCGLRPNNLLIDCNHVLSTEPTGPHCEILTMLECKLQQKLFENSPSTPGSGSVTSVLFKTSFKIDASLLCWGRLQ